MPNKIVSRNTMILGAGASAVNDYYNGFSITVTRLNTVTGKETLQKKKIIDYDGSTKVATIDGVWDILYTPAPGDSYKIVPTYADSRVSINTAIQALDYITSTTYGRGLNITKDLDFPTWLESARACDAKSDITILR